MEPAQPSPARRLKVALLAWSPFELSRLPDLLDGVALQPSELQVWVPVKRFHAPIGIPGPYRSLALQAAKEVTAEEIQLADEVGRGVCSSWQADHDWHLTYQVLVDADVRKIASEVIDRQIDLMICRGKGSKGSGAVSADLTTKLARHLPCPLLLLPPAR